MKHSELACEREPIHIPGRIQPRGFLIAVDSNDWTVTRASANALACIGGDTPTPIARTESQSVAERGGPSRTALDLGSELAAVDHFERDADWARITHFIERLRLTDRSAPTVHKAVHYAPVEVGSGTYVVIAHAAGAETIFEFEARDDASDGSLDILYPDIREAIESIQAEVDLSALFSVGSAVFRDLTGFDRVLIYQFDEQANGTVVGEANSGALPTYLNLRFPASDIPAQARELYRANRVRVIPDAEYVPIDIVDRPAVAMGPLDLSFSALRAVSPVHLEYMRNMGTPASFSVSILVDGALWGLVSCHHARPKQVPHHVRSACDLLAQVLATQIAGQVRSALDSERVQRQRTQSQLLAFMAQEEQFFLGLTAHPAEWLAFVDADGAAVVVDGVCTTAGLVPDDASILKIVTWLGKHHPTTEVFATDALSEIMPGTQHLAGVASGVVAISVSQIHSTYVLWFRPEVVRTVSWGGDPNASKRVVGERLHPRESFALWKESVRFKAQPWSVAQLESVSLLRHAILGIVLRRAEELADLSRELKRSNKELEAFSYSVSHDLRAPFRHIVGYGELLLEDPALEQVPSGKRYVSTIIESAQTAGKLVDGLLGFSQAGRSSLKRTTVDIDKVVAYCRAILEPDMKGRNIEWDVPELGSVVADATMMRQVFQNLLSNAIKYTRGNSLAHISLTVERKQGMATFSVKDNGVGFDMAYTSKLFGVFQRLHRMEQFEGTGIGLANVRRIAQRHGGTVWAEGKVDEGATFYFSIPDRAE